MRAQLLQGEVVEQQFGEKEIAFRTMDLCEWDRCSARGGRGSQRCFCCC